MADWSQFNPWAAPRFADFIRSPNIEDRRNEHYLRTREVGPFGTTGETPNVFESSGIMPLDPNAPPIQRTPAGVALGQDEVERALLKQQQDNQVRDALDNAPVAVPGVSYNPSDAPLRIDYREGKAGGGPFANPVPLTPQLGLNNLMDMLRQYGLAGPAPFTNTQEPRS